MINQSNDRKDVVEVYLASIHEQHVLERANAMVWLNDFVQILTCHYDPLAFRFRCWCCCDGDHRILMLDGMRKVTVSQ